jgi:DNA-binding response OmpR family regulator
VLVVDDDEDLAAVLSELLESHGMEAEVAPPGTDGLVLLRRSSPVLCILDWSLPDGEPTQLVAECRTRNVPIVLSSAVGEADELAAQIGAAAILPKPFDVDSLYRIIDSLRGASLVT